MAVFVQKVWHKKAGIIPEGVGVSFSRTRYYLYVLNTDGDRIALFKAREVKKYWIVTDPCHRDMAPLTDGDAPRVA